MNKIILPNRDGADLWLEQSIDNPELWNLKVDDAHEYCLKYMRMGGNYDVKKDHSIFWNEIVMVDPAGGPYVEIGDRIGNYIISEFIDGLTWKLTLVENERNNN